MTSDSAQAVSVEAQTPGPSHGHRGPVGPWAGLRAGGSPHWHWQAAAAGRPWPASATVTAAARRHRARLETRAFAIKIRRAWAASEPGQDNVRPRLPTRNRPGRPGLAPPALRRRPHRRRRPRRNGRGRRGAGRAKMGGACGGGGGGGWAGGYRSRRGGGDETNRCLRGGGAAQGLASRCPPQVASGAATPPSEARLGGPRRGVWLRQRSNSDV